MTRRTSFIVQAVLVALLPTGSTCATESEQSIEALRAEIEALKRERRATDQRISAIESKLEQLIAGTRLESEGAATTPAVRDESARIARSSS